MTRDDRLQRLRARFDGTRYDADVPLQPGVPLSNRASRTGTTVHGWRAVSFGAPVAAIGLWFVAQVLGFVEADAGSATRGEEAWAIALIGGLFGFAGLWLVMHGLRGVRCSARVRAWRAIHPAEPWRWDYAWDERVARDDTAARARHFVVVGAFVLALIAPFHWVVYFGPRAALPFGIVALLFDAIGVGLLVAAGYFFLRRLKYGAGVARFAHFPFRCGSTLELHVDAPRALPQHAVARATLRCIQERYVTRGTGEDRTTGVECFEMYRDTAPAELVGAGAGRHALRVSFAIPADAPTTDLASRPCRYWEVDIEAATDGVDYMARFLVPVY